MVRTCEKCGGAGRITKDLPDGFTAVTNCPDCKGTGLVRRLGRGRPKKNEALQNLRAYAQGCDDFMAGIACKGAKGVMGDPQCPRLYINCCAFCSIFEGGIKCEDRCPILSDFEDN